MQSFAQSVLLSPRTTIDKFVRLDSVDTSFGELPFLEAFNLWLETHAPFIQLRTLQDYKQYGQPLCLYMGAFKLKDIGVMTVRGYQLWRSKEHGAKNGFEHGAGNVRIRNEINGVLKPLLKEADLWDQIKKRKFKHLPVSEDGAGMLLTKEDQREILGIAFSDRRWYVAGHILKIMYRSGCGLGELSHVRRRDVDIEAGRMSIIVGAKNNRRVRTLKLVPSALESLCWIMKRADRLGATDQNDYILPHRSLLRNHHGSFDRPMSSIHYAWVAIRKSWIRAHPHKQHKSKARVYDARPSAATLLLSNPKIAPEMVDKVLGWRPNSRMRKRYNVAEQEMMREAMDTLEDAQ